MDAYAGFEGTVGRVFATSEPWWPPRPTAPEGAPNVVVMLVDDLGFSDVGCFGSEIETPNLDRIAAEGLRFTDFHVTPMCSPTRAALLTGVNPHAAGMATVCHSDPGFPGYAMELAEDTATMAEVLRDAGYSTLMVGKWHLTKDSQQHDGADRSSWPCQRGFDRFYGFLDGFTNAHHPHRLVEDNHTVEVDRYADGYYVTDDLTDRAVAMVRTAKASNPTKPFFLYFSHAAMHAPLQAKADDIARYADRYQAGWDAIRDARYRRQLELGVIEPGTELAPRNHEPDNEVPAWDELTADEQRLFAGYMAVYAGMLDNVDQNLGRLRTALEDLGEWENTVFVFLADNGASREGEAQGTSAYFRTLNMLIGEDLEQDLGNLELLGGPRTLPHYPRGWAMVGNTPFRLYKINAHQGGHRVATVVSWPARLRDPGGLRRQYQHVTDLLPTLCELIGIDPPTARNGIALQPPAGASFAAALEDPDAPSTHPEQYIECVGHRGFYRDGWEAVTVHRAHTAFSTEPWELFDVRRDPSQVHDLAARHPEKLAELQTAWEQAAWANQVFPLDEGTGLKYVLRPPTEEQLRSPVRIAAGTPTLERYRSQQLINLRSYRIDIDLEHHTGDEGVLVAHGDQGGGYVCYVEDGELVYAHNGYGHLQELRCGPLADGARAVSLDVASVGQQRLQVEVRVDATTVAEGGPFPLLMAMAPFEGIDVGIDRRSPVSWPLYERRGCFPYTGRLRAVTYTPGDWAPDLGPQFAELLVELGRAYE
ncbi:MAG: arylsulfatase [Acidimicrobiales bacterium]|jgi:arylsulfatase|nr:arylsulfatase [Acidimicrobiales bacterium]